MPVNLNPCQAFVVCTCVLLSSHVEELSCHVSTFSNGGSRRFSHHRTPVRSEFSDSLSWRADESYRRTSGDIGRHLGWAQIGGKQSADHLFDEEDDIFLTATDRKYYQMILDELSPSLPKSAKLVEHRKEDDRYLGMGGGHKIRHARYRQGYGSHVMTKVKSAGKLEQPTVTGIAHAQIGDSSPEGATGHAPPTNKHPPKFYFHTVQMDNKTVVAVNIK